MLTIFTTGKAFTGHSGVIQRNALRSWMALDGGVEIILFGDEEGAAEVARELGIVHEGYVMRDEAGLKRIDYMFDRAEEMARHEVLCYVNCDIILADDFVGALRRAATAHRKFLMVGRRWDTNITAPIDFTREEWAEGIRRRAQSENKQRDEWFIDYFAFSRGLYEGKIPPLVVGRVHWDNWLVWYAGHAGATVVDASGAVCAVHQNHDYGYHADGKEGVWSDEQARRNFELACGYERMRPIGHAAVLLREGGRFRHNWRREWREAKMRAQAWARGARRVATYSAWLPAWHFVLGITRPVRNVLGLRSKGVS